MKKVLIFSGGEQIGDGILKLEIVYQLRERFPNYEIYWATDKISTVYNSTLKKFTNKHIDIIWDKSNLSPYPWKNLSDKYDIHNYKFDIIVDIQKAVTRTLALRRVKSRLFVSSTANWIFSDIKPSSKPFKNLFYVRNITQIFDLVSNCNKKKISQLNIPYEIKKLVSEIFDKEKKYIGFAPGAGQKEKIWSLKNYIQLAKHYESNGIKPVFFLGPLEKILKFEILKNIRNPIFPEELVKNISGIEAVMASSEFLNCAVGNDSGTSNMLATNLCPLIKLCGPTNPRKFINDNFENIHFISSRDYGGKDINLIPEKKVREKIDELLKF